MRLAGRERPPAVIDPLRKSVFVCGGEIYVRFHVRSPVFGGCRCHEIRRSAPWSLFAWRASILANRTEWCNSRTDPCLSKRPIR